MLAFAANSVLCRLAMERGAVDAASFTAVRLLSGALALYLIVLWRANGSASRPGGSWPSAFMLFLYAAAFSIAYLELTTATGALILFGAVQLTMVLGGIIKGELPTPREWGGLAVALAGFIVLLLPGLQAPALWAALTMIVAGAAWGAYSLSGRGPGDPMAATAGNFSRSIPFALALFLAFLPHLQITPAGILLAAASGAVASAMGYVVWYAALQGLSATRGAAVQLCVPVIAAAGGVLLLGEVITMRWGFSATAVLGGIGLALSGRRRN
jgi:drug/metabolite transporter (DMT)-like permease